MTLFRQVLEDLTWWCCRIKADVLWVRSVQTSPSQEGPSQSCSNLSRWGLSLDLFHFDFNDGFQTSVDTGADSREVFHGCGWVWWPQDISLGLQGLFFSKVQGCCWKWCSWALKGGCCQLRAGERLSYLSYLKTQMGITLDHSQNLSGFGASDLQVKGFVPFTVPGELRTLNCSHTCFSVTAALGARCAAPECPLLATFQLFTLYFLGLTEWHEDQQATWLVMGQSRFFPPSPSSQIVVACVKLCLMVDQPITSCNPSQRSSHDIQTMDALHSLPAFSLCSSSLWTGDFVPWGSSILVIPCPKGAGLWGQTPM